MLWEIGFLFLALFMVGVAMYWKVSSPLRDLPNYYELLQLAKK